MVVFVDAIFVSTRGMTASRMMAAATDKAVIPISMAGVFFSLRPILFYVEWSVPKIN
jgi:hypothetical protein